MVSGRAELADRCSAQRNGWSRQEPVDNFRVFCGTNTFRNYAKVCSKNQGERGNKMKFTFRFTALMAAFLFMLMAVPSPTLAQNYNQTNLVADLPTTATAAHYDANLKNPWGLTRSPSSPWWVSDNNAGLSTLYDGEGDVQGLVVKIPGPSGSPSTFVSAPTGTVYNGTTSFGGAHFIFVTEDGTIS